MEYPSINFLNEDSVLSTLTKETAAALSKKTKRNGTDINLRSLIYDCIRATYFQIFDYESKVSEEMVTYPYLTVAGQLGDVLHKKFQDIIGLNNYEWTEKLVSFKTFAPLVIRSKCDGIDTDNNIMYEIKTKDKVPTKPVDEELAQNIFSAFLFSKEFNVQIYGSTMIYISRGTGKFKFFHYDLINPSSSNYLNVQTVLNPIFEKILIIQHCMQNKTPPPFGNKYIKSFAYGKCACNECAYSSICGSPYTKRRK